MSSLDYLDLCRLCLVKDRVSVPIFEDEGDVRQIFLKITACLPVKVGRDDKLPKKICDDCVYKVELFYQFWNTTANAEKQLLQWLGEVGGLEEKQGYVTDILNQNVMKQERNSENRLEGSLMQVSGHPNNMDINMMDENMTLSIPMMIPTGNQQISVPMDSVGNTVQAVPGPSTQASLDQVSQSQVAVSSRQDEEDETSDEDDNTDDDCDNEGLPVKEESEDDPNSSRNLEPATFVNVSLCDEAGPSGLQQQKISEMSEIAIPQTSDGDPKTEYFVTKLTVLPLHQPHNQQCNDGKDIKVFTVNEANLLITEPLNIPASKSENSASTNIVITESTFPCVLCGIGFVSEQLLTVHLKTHEELPIEPHQQIEESKGFYQCEQCGRSFTSCSSLRKHQLLHTNEKMHMCSTCGYTSAHRQNLATHQRRHNLEYKYNCEICGAGFYARNNYTEHQSMHSREKPFQCDVCKATFRYRQGLRLHAKLHQPDYIPPQKKHSCEVCNKRFCRKQVLSVHMRTHGNIQPQNEYICHICGKSVSSKTYLTVHVRKHTGEKPHICDICGKGFICQNYLSVHRRTHTGERPHKCTHCDKRFTQRTTLVVHLRSHTGDRPYPCTDCHKSFASKTMLNSHLKTHAKQIARVQQDQLLPSHLPLETTIDLMPS